MRYYHNTYKCSFIFERYVYFLQEYIYILQKNEIKLKFKKNIYIFTTREPWVTSLIWETVPNQSTVEKSFDYTISLIKREKLNGPYLFKVKSLSPNEALFESLVVIDPVVLEEIP